MSMSYIPFAYALNYTSIVDAAFAHWMDEHAHDFVLESETGFYIYNGKRLSAAKLQHEFWPIIASAIFEVFDWIRTTDKTNTTYFLFVVNSREHESDSSERKWIFGEESDIKLNFPLFEEIFQKIFDRLFKLQVKNKNEDIFYLQAEDLSYNTVLISVIERLFGTTHTMDLTTKFKPKHLIDAHAATDVDNQISVENAISSTLDWVERMTSLSAKT